MTKQQQILLAEFVGTFLLASAVFAGFNPFIALAVLVLLIGGISGAHVNPAVTLGLTSVKKHKANDVLPYWIAQVVGGLAAIYLAAYLADTSVSFEALSFDGREAVAEFVGTAIFLTGIVAAVNQKLTGFALAAAVGGSLFLGASLGGGLNPAIMIGSGQINLWSMVAIFLGGVAGAQIGSMLTSKPAKSR